MARQRCYYLKLALTDYSYNKFRLLLDKFLKDNRVDPSSEYLVLKSRLLGSSSGYFIIRGNVEPHIAELKLHVHSMSFWKSHPSTYNGASEKYDIIEGLPELEVNKYSEFITALKSQFKTCDLNSNSKNNGQSKDQLQGEDSPDSGCSEGCILYGGGNVAEYSAGRHCDQARNQEARGGIRRPEVIVSLRHAKVLGDSH